MPYSPSASVATSTDPKSVGCTGTVAKREDGGGEVISAVDRCIVSPRVPSSSRVDSTEIGSIAGDEPNEIGICREAARSRDSCSTHAASRSFWKTLSPKFAWDSVCGVVVTEAADLSLYL